jgi:hypothetical protein
MFEPKGDENISDGYPRHQNPIAALSCSWLLTFRGERTVRKHFQLAAYFRGVLV